MQHILYVFTEKLSPILQQTLFTTTGRSLFADIFGGRKEGLVGVEARPVVEVTVGRRKVRDSDSIRPCSVRRRCSDGATDIR